ncbi:MAG: DUF3566 domain-containing protein [Actinomycetales bacterium]|nr:DUF3566 domain-containing protein [Actinomycetales bacterium]
MSTPGAPPAAAGDPPTAGGAAAKTAAAIKTAAIKTAAAATAPSAKSRSGTRRVRLAVSRVDPWSAMKISFLLSFAAGIGLVVTTMVLWMILSGMSVFNDIDGLVKSMQPNSADPFTIMDYISFPRVTSLAMVVAVVDVILLTALGTLSAYLYNLSAALVGGVQLTLTDD